MRRCESQLNTDVVLVSPASKAAVGRDGGRVLNSVKLVRLWLVAADSQNRTLMGRPPAAAAAAAVASVV